MQTIGKVLNKKWTDDWLSRFIVLLNLTALVAIPVVIAYKIYMDYEWQAFAQENNCQKLDANVDGYRDVNEMNAPDEHPLEVHSSMFTPNKTGWQCNNGMTYWR